MLRRATTLFFCLFFFAPSHLASEEDKRYCKPSYYDYDAAYSYNDLQRYSLAQVWAPEEVEAVSGYKGNAIVVDEELGLVLTAAHVVNEALNGHHRPRGKSVSLYFPEMSDSQVFNAKVIDYHLGAIPDEPDDLPLEDQVRDLALLQIEDVENRVGIRSVRLSFDSNKVADAAMVSFTQRSTTPTQTTGKLSELQVGLGRNANCSFDFSEASASGKSGSPVVDRSNGQVVGIVLTAAHLGAEAHSTVLPIYCAADLFYGWTQSHFKDHLKNKSDRLIDMTHRELADHLKHNKDKDLISNLILHAAILNFVDEVTNDGLTQERLTGLRSKFWCPLMEAMKARNVDLSSTKLDLLSQKMYATNSTRESADLFLREAQLNQKTNANAANNFALAASELYHLDRENKKRLGVDTDQYAKTVKGYADSLLLAGITEQNTIQKEVYFKKARFAALEAALHASVFSDTLSAHAITTFADAELRLNRKQKAAEGFAAAIKNGVRDQWVLEGLEQVSPGTKLSPPNADWDITTSGKNLAAQFTDPQHFVLRQLSELGFEGDELAVEFYAKDSLYPELTLTPPGPFDPLSPPDPRRFWGKT